jgi:carbonic anhydrase/acetyltransferase-like protein (isoleucine patch superfamily)
MKPGVKQTGASSVNGYYSSMALYELDGKRPSVAQGAFIAPTSSLIGDVVVEEDASVWFGAVIRADFDRIVVGAGATIQDNSVIHCGPGMPTLIAPEVTIGHGALLDSCTIENGALIGSGAVILHRALVGAGCLVAAGSVVMEGQICPPGVLMAGVPATIRETIGTSAINWLASSGPEYRRILRRYGTLVEITPS